jgi:hypothetical protein
LPVEFFCLFLAGFSFFALGFFAGFRFKFSLCGGFGW